LSGAEGYLSIAIKVHKFYFKITHFFNNVEVQFFVDQELHKRGVGGMVLAIFAVRGG
jgi:hypothetical protein